MAIELGIGRPAPGDGKEVALDPFASACRAPTATEGTDIDRGQPQSPMSRDHGAPRGDGKAGAARLLREEARRARTGIDDPTNLDPRLVERKSGLIPGVVGSEYHCRATRPDRPAAHIVTHRRCQHHTRPVIVRKRDGPLHGTRGEHHLLRTDLPQASARGARPVGALVQQDVAVIANARGRGRREDRNIGKRSQPLCLPLGPLGARHPADLRLISEEAPADPR